MWVYQSCPTLCDTMGCSLPGFSVHGILPTRILEWVAMPSSRGSSQPRDQICVSYVSYIGRQILYHYYHLGSPHSVTGSRIILYLFLYCPVLLLLLWFPSVTLVIFSVTALILLFKNYSCWHKGLSEYKWCLEVSDCPWDVSNGF